MTKLGFALCLGCSLVATDGLGQVQESTDYRFSETPEPAPPKSHRVFVMRLAVLGAHRELFDLSLNAAGVEGSIGGEGERHGGHANFHLMRGATTGGLTITEFGLTGTYELHLSGVRLGVGSGVTNFTIARATTGAGLSSTGFELLFRAGYDFAEPSGPYLLGQLDYQAYNGGTDGAAAWGPTLYAGWRF